MQKRLKKKKILPAPPKIESSSSMAVSMNIVEYSLRGVPYLSGYFLAKKFVN